MIVITEPKKLSFSGHESFQCRSLWLKKGYDFLKAGNSFSNENAVVKLGVGKNMVNAIRYWMRAFGLTKSDSDDPSDLAHKLFNDIDGWDPYLEDIATLWLLHYQLVITNRASIYGLIFNSLRRDKIEFTRSHFINYAKRQAETSRTVLSENSVKTDFDVFVRMYLHSDIQVKDRDESLTGLLTDLNLIRSFRRRKEEDFFVIDNTDKSTLPDAILLYGILANRQFDFSINFNTLLTEPDQVGSVFALNASGLYAKLERIVSNTINNAVFSDQAGIRELSFKSIPDPMTILANYYES
ncbi:DUF4007 family protein [Runella sp. MFBS21]|uniref:DUF4007 family protein n=1 Tax=Runella sp. MFBS21 TaxID=3034018 RepID=UPI0023FA3C9A|nr:DUF4007 family protein [Runella sp. MFBS21]MDF7820843.1 DUF4007 family protein [Runella sp. MFBS21]